MVIEINTSSLRKGHSETMPGDELLALYKDCGGRYVAVGSDAHEVQDVGADGDSTRELLCKYGLSEAVYERRKRL